MSAGLSGTNGKIAEQQAVKMLRRHGLKILARNYRAPRGEIDIIADDQGTLVFAEVRLRSDTAFGRPDETITTRKQHSIIHAAEHYLASERAKKPDHSRPCRFDAICLSPEAGRGEGYAMEWLRDAFRVGDC